MRKWEGRVERARHEKKMSSRRFAIWKLIEILFNLLNPWGEWKEKRKGFSMKRKRTGSFLKEITGSHRIKRLLLFTIGFPLASSFLPDYIDS
ncbi:MAG: hypothetical protein A2156_03695 [Deltaproteobacteria bacterium RBG_16_48_10]|nr:MAG: hypothetical protein A2156_03695 [Deltaproteobacteria bacterium RBG_16_48_10]